MMTQHFHNPKVSTTMHFSIQLFLQKILVHHNESNTNELLNILAYLIYSQKRRSNIF